MGLEKSDLAAPFIHVQEWRIVEHADDILDFCQFEFRDLKPLVERLNQQISHALTCCLFQVSVRLKQSL